MSDPCECGHGPRDHHRWELAETITAGFVEAGALPQGPPRMMRTHCRVTVGRDPWGPIRCGCLLYIEQSLVDAHPARLVDGEP